MPPYTKMAAGVMNTSSSTWHVQRQFVIVVTPPIIKSSPFLFFHPRPRRTHAPRATSSTSRAASTEPLTDFHRRNPNFQFGDLRQASLEMSSSSTNPLESSPVNDPGPDQDTPVNGPDDSSIPEQVSRCTGLRVVSIDSESDSDYLESDDPYSFDLASHEEVVDGGGFEWEEVAGESNDVVEEVTALSPDYFTDDEEDERWEVGGGGSRGRISADRDLEWELLVAVNNVTGNLFFNNDLLDDIDGDAYYVEDSSDALFDQFMDNVAEIRGSPPAAKEVVENLPVVFVEEGDSELNGGDCAVCKDEVGFGVRVRTLPCSHYYHEECILPWLGMRNTCPVCRYELPTDDAEYERNKSGNRQGRPASWDIRVNEEFELFV